MRTRTCMATKTLTITEDAYNLLKSDKLESESFSQLVTRHFGKKKFNLMDYFGILSIQERDNIKKFLEDKRKINLAGKKRRYNLE
jgi:predicted CopG family antitoxin